MHGRFPHCHAGREQLQCTAATGDHTIEYTLTAPAGMDAWRLDTHVIHDIYNYARYGSALDRKATFTAGTGALHLRHQLLARDTAGYLYRLNGTGKPAAPFSPRSPIGPGWQAYNQLTKLSPVTEDVDYADGAPAGALRSHGDLVARDASGTLWYYQRQFIYEPAKMYKARTKVSTGWNTYTLLAGAGDVSGDKLPDLLTRDGSGVLWLHKGTGKATSPFATRTKVGGGWNTYNKILGGADLTGDRKPDLVARDTSGTLWLDRGTGQSSTPFTTRTKIGGGWQAYNALTVVGDVTDNGKADLLARDATGALWLYKGTGLSSAPFATRTKISTGWQGYNTLV
ncbi:FG-GAP repeat domain-containing protein [Streptomyces sp. NPDC101132]|uniref:FG-GAP repeat domain-containing protein n=1 Tax=Streptomyces sp. NPDC101132 TaxID=3366110 RepID=UPI00382142CE